jgi:uncharacterized protein YqgV (UPF0045/DUF77 family)
MTASAQIAIYPLRQERLAPAIEAVTQALLDHGLRPEPGPMSTYVAGEADILFAALGQAFAGASALGQVVMTLTVSNACPIPDHSTDA